MSLVSIDVARVRALLAFIVLSMVFAGTASGGGWSIEKVVLEGDPGPPGGGPYVNLYSGLSLNDAGDVGFVAGLDSDPAAQATVVMRGDGSIDAVLMGPPARSA